MGRGKMAMQLITKEKARTLTFQKRKKSLFKKAFELSVLCDVDVCVIISRFPNADPSKSESETWPENLVEVGRIIANYEAKSLSKRCKTDGQSKANSNAQSVDKMAIKAKFPDWDNRMNCFSAEQLFEILNSINRKLTVVDQRLNTLLTTLTHQFSIVDQFSGPEQLINQTSSFQSDFENFGFGWGNECPETESNLGVLDNEMLPLQMQPQTEFPLQLIEYPTAVTPLQSWHPPLLPHPSIPRMYPTAVTPLQSWHPPLLPHPSIPRMPLLPHCHTPWPDLINGGYYEMMDDEYSERLSTMNGFCNFSGI